jgi:hypothetical protein
MIRACAASAAIIASLALFGVSQARAQQTELNAEDQIRAFDKLWCDAEATHDRKALERMLDEGFVATFESGETFEKTAFIDQIMKYKFPGPFNLVHDVVRVYGDTAVAVSRFGYGDNLGTKLTSVYVKRNGRWRAVAEQMTGMPAPVPAATAQK